MEDSASSASSASSPRSSDEEGYVSPQSLQPGDEIYGFIQETGWWRRATILDTRQREIPEGEEEDDDDPLEYYVHFYNMNRRNDRWLVPDWVKTETPDDFDEMMDDEKADYSDESDHEGMTEQDIKEWEKATRVKRIDKIMIGKFLVETWYWSPYPEEYQQCSTLHICEFCLSFFKERQELQWHIPTCKTRHPPGDEIYSAPDGISVFEVDGFFERIYCENLCYISKLFLDHKRFDRFDVSNFYFYCVGEWDAKGFHIVGYFSKEKQVTNRNLSCIMLLPCYQRRGFGSFLIDVSYELSRISGKLGTPERPLSDLGKRTYLRWWLQRILRLLRDNREPMSIQDITNATMILQDDVKMTLDEFNLLKYVKGQFHIYLPQALYDQLYVPDNTAHVKFKPEYLHWTPLILPEATPNKE